jgi:hypothetical protein
MKNSRRNFSITLILSGIIFVSLGFTSHLLASFAPGATLDPACTPDDPTCIVSTAGSNGTIQYNNAGVQSGDDNLVWDDTNSLLGIGTATPSQELHIEAGSQIITAGDIVAVGSAKDEVDGVKELEGPGTVEIIGKYAYVTGTTDDGLDILDISNPANPIHVGFITDNGTTALDGAKGLDVVGKYAYIASSIDNGVEILDISNPALPVHVGAIFDNGSRALSYPVDIQVVGKYAYVTSYFKDSLEIIDISNPAVPRHVSYAFDVAGRALDGAWGLDVVGKYAYVASYVDEGVEILDISNPAVPVHAGSIFDNNPSCPASDCALNGAWDIKVIGNYAYVVSYISGGIQILDISNPAAIVHVSTFLDNDSSCPSSNCGLAGAHSIEISGNYAYVTSNTDDALQIIDISNPAVPTHIKTIYKSANVLLDGAGDISITGGYAYITSYVDNALQIFSLSSLTTPTANIGNLASDDITIWRDLNVGANAVIGGGLNVGSGGLHIQGESSFSSKMFAPSLATSTGSPDALCIDPTTHEFTVNTGTATCTVSSLKYKDNVEEMNRGLDIIRELRPVTYTYKNNPESRTNFGLIAEEVFKIEPRLVYFEKDSTIDTRGIHQLDFIFINTKAIQELDVNIKSLEDMFINDTSFRQRLSSFFTNSTERLSGILKIESVDTNSLITNELRIYNEEGIEGCIRVQNETIIFDTDCNGASNSSSSESEEESESESEEEDIVSEETTPQSEEETSEDTPPPIETEEVVTEETTPPEEETETPPSGDTTPPAETEAVEEETEENTSTEKPIEEEIIEEPTEENTPTEEEA